MPHVPFQALTQRHVLYLGTDHHVHELYWEPSTGYWHYGGDLTTLSGAGLHPATEEPTGFAFDAEGTQFVPYQGSDGHIHLLWWNSRSGWSWIDMTANYGGPLGASPTGYVLPSDGTLHVVYRGQQGGHLYEFWRNSSRAWQPANDLTALTGAPSAIRRPASYASETRQHIVFMGNDGDIHELRWVY